MTTTEQKARTMAKEIAKQYYIATGFTADQELLVKLLAYALLDFRKQGLEEAAKIADIIPCENGEKQRLADTIAQAIRKMAMEE